MQIKSKQVWTISIGSEALKTQGRTNRQYKLQRSCSVDRYAKILETILKNKIKNIYINVFLCMTDRLTDKVN